MVIGGSNLYRKCACRNIPPWNYGDHGSDEIAAVCCYACLHSVFYILNESLRDLGHNINGVVFADYRYRLSLRNPLSPINMPFDNDSVKWGPDDFFLKFYFEALDIGL